MNMVDSLVPTSAITFLETEHGRLRRKQRGIDKKDLQSARKYGVRTKRQSRTKDGDPTVKYQYKGIVYIVNGRTGQEVTSYAVPLELDPVPITISMEEDHERIEQKKKHDLDLWTSNTVMIVDTSGSMRTSDIWGTRNRLGAVWVAIALDFVAHRLETGAGLITDMISIVVLAERPAVVIREAPCDWLLYNRLVYFYMNSSIEPFGHGPFLPCLKEAEKLLLRNPNASCAMCLTFLSDGKPSDASIARWCPIEESEERHKRMEDAIVDQVGDLAKRFGRRLTFQAVGIGDFTEFAVLQKMVDQALDYGAKAQLSLPSMSSSSIGDVFTSVATSISETQTELVDEGGLKQLQVRNVIRESRKKASAQISVVSKDDFYLYPIHKVRRMIYKEWFDEDNKKHKDFEDVPLQSPDAKYVAFCKESFGEGAERLAYRFFEVASDEKTIIGKALVAKESRLVLEDTSEHARKKYVRQFCSTQQLAARVAEEFNLKLHGTRRVHEKTPRIKFLDCSIYETDDSKLGKLRALVEEKLDHNKWTKWNSNNGYVQGMQTPVHSAVTLRDAMVKLTEMEEIKEDSEEAESDGDDDHNEPQLRHGRDVTPIVFTPFQVAQAFSHFSYMASRRRRLVCDLQGVFDEHDNVLLLSDPVIHYYNAFNTDRRNVHGRTDRGRKGMAMFFQTHHEFCGHLCKLVNRGFRRYRPPKQNSAPS